MATQLKRKHVLTLGDQKSGKFCMLHRYTKGEFVYPHRPTEEDIFERKENVDGEEVMLWLTIGGSTDEYFKLRINTYKNIKPCIILLCFSVGNRESFTNIRKKWYPEIKQYCSDIPVFIVGSKNDLREDEEFVLELAKHDVVPVTVDEGQQLAQETGAQAYLECSAKTNEGIEELFHTVAKTAGMVKPKKECIII